MMTNLATFIVLAITVNHYTVFLNKMRWNNWVYHITVLFCTCIYIFLFCYIHILLYFEIRNQIYRVRFYYINQNSKHIMVPKNSLVFLSRKEIVVLCSIWSRRYFCCEIKDIFMFFWLDRSVDLHLCSVIVD